MAGKKASGGEAASHGERGASVKLVKRHTEFVEADVEGTQETDPPKQTGSNPYRERTAAWAAWENRKRQDRGLPATNDL